MGGWKLTVIAVIVVLCQVHAQTEVLVNPGFEQALGSEWTCNVCTGSLSNDVQSGSNSYHASGRTATWQGPIQTLPLGTNIQPGVSYHFIGYVKVLQATGQNFIATIVYTKPDNSMQWVGIANVNNVASTDGWVLLESDFTALDIGQIEMKFYVEGPDAGVDFLVDSLSIVSNQPVTTTPATTTTTSSADILVNPGFETSLNGNWVCNGGCTGTQVTDSHTGTFAYQASNRGASWQGPLQSLPFGTQIFSGQYYMFQGYVKITQNVANPQDLRATVKYTLSGGSVHYVPIARARNVSPSSGWTLMAGDFQVIDGVTAMDLYIEGGETVDFLVDSLSLTHIVTDNSWRTDAQQRINTIRKGMLNIEIDPMQNRASATIRVTQDKHEFGFGTAVDAQTLSSNANYRQWYLDNFEYAVLENDFKWRQTESVEGQFTYANADAGMAILTNNSKAVRGHTILWANQARNPDWVQQITNPTQMYSKVMKRIGDLLGRYNGQCVHWDVNNEMVDNSFYMDVYNSDPTIRYDMFREARIVDPSAKLFLNDYNVVANGLNTYEYLSQAQEFLAAGAPVDGLGVQSHLDGDPIAPVLLTRIDLLAAAGLPIWVTELDYANSDENVRAQVLEDVLLAYFSHSSVEGVLLWGFWDGRLHAGADAALVNGANFVDNAAGTMWKRLMHTDWRSNEDIVVNNLVINQRVNQNVGVFYGDYTIDVLSSGGNVLATTKVSVNKATGSASVTISV